MRLMVYSDGGSRGNPGPAASAFLILDEKMHVLKKASRCVGKRTNNQAEYEALLGALEAAKTLGGEELVCHLDSELVTKHLTGEYRVKDPEMRKLWLKVQELKRCFRQVRFVNVPRTNSYIRDVDRLVNQALDESL